MLTTTPPSLLVKPAQQPLLIATQPLCPTSVCLLYTSPQYSLKPPGQASSPSSSDLTGTAAECKQHRPVVPPCKIPKRPSENRRKRSGTTGDRTRVSSPSALQAGCVNHYTTVPTGHTSTTTPLNRHTSLSVRPPPASSTYPRAKACATWPS